VNGVMSGMNKPRSELSMHPSLHCPHCVDPVQVPSLICKLT